jgi:hypothetical protein
MAENQQIVILRVWSLPLSGAKGGGEGPAFRLCSQGFGKSGSKQVIQKLELNFCLLSSAEQP